MMKAKYVVVSVALFLSCVFGGIYIKFLTTINNSITIYVCQVGIYKEEANAEETKQRLAGLELPNYSYTKEDTVIVISDIFLSEEDANALGTTISQNEMTCAIRKYTIAEDMKEKIEKKEYDDVLVELSKQ